jgi:hypothetical protein
MIEEPLLLATSVGPIGAILTLPDEAPRATVLFVSGAGGTRAGVNQMWSRAARSACEHGVAVLRADYAGMGESWDADPRERFAGVRHLARWACERTGDVPLLVISTCFGLGPTLSICRDRAVAGAAAVIPPIWPAGVLKPVVVRRSIANRVQAKLGRVPALPRRVAFRVRYGPAQGSAWHEQAEPTHPLRDVFDLVTATPTWLLMGSKDTCAEPALSLLPKLQERGQVELKVVDGLMLRQFSTREIQDVVCDNVVAWVARSASRLEAPA